MIKTVLALSAMAATFAVQAAVRAVTPAPADAEWTKSWWMKRHAEKVGIATNGGAKVVFIGDSITHGWEGSGRGVWEKFFAEGPFRAINLGYNGDRTEHVLWRLQNGEIDGYEAKAIVLMIGTNNTGHFQLKDEAPSNTVAGIAAILRVIAERQPKAKTILLPIFPRDVCNHGGNRIRNDAVNHEILKFVDGKRVVWCDFTDRFLTPDGNLSRELFPDLLHPNALGYEIWASSLIPTLERVLAASQDAYVPSLWASGARYWKP